MPLTRDEILGTADIATALVPAPRWGGEVLVREMPMASPAYVAYVNSHRDKRFVINTPQGPQINANEHQIRRHVGAVILCAIDPDTHQPLFKWSDADDLREKHWNTVLAVATKAYELAAGDGPDDLNALESIDRVINYAVNEGWQPEQVATLAAFREQITVTDKPPAPDEETPPAPLAIVPDAHLEEAQEGDPIED
jgi:hypothetical protein